MVELGFIFWGKRLKLMASETLSRTDRHTTVLKLQNSFLLTFMYKKVMVEQFDKPQDYRVYILKVLVTTWKT